MGIVVDTSALTAAERGRETQAAGARRTGSSILGRLANESAVPPAAVYAELLAVVHLGRSDVQAAARRARIAADTARVPIIEFNFTRPRARVLAALRRSGEAIPAKGLSIAATSLHLDLAVSVSLCGELHFRRVPGLPRL